MVLRNKRNKRLISIYPELSDIYKQVKKRCILDGEVLVLNDGKPSFFEVQRRSLMSNPFKINLAAKQLPACFTAFDILYLGDKQITDFPLLKRKTLLLNTVKESPQLAISRHIENDGLAYQIFKENCTYCNSRNGFDFEIGKIESKNIKQTRGKSYEQKRD